MNLRRFLLFVTGGLACLGLSSCGQTDQSVIPPAVNPFAAARVGTDSTLEVMTWNIENMAKSTTTVAWVKQIVEGLEPDVVAVQEISSGTAFDNLAGQLNGWSGSRARSDSYQNLGFLYRTGGVLGVTSVYEILTSYSRAFPRSPYVLEGTFDGIPFVVIGNHLKASGNGLLDETDPWDEETRRRDACVMLAEFITANFPGQRVFVVGDWNDALTDNPPNNVFQNFLDAPSQWRFADMAIAQDMNGLWSYPGWPSHLDHILVTEALIPALVGPAAATMVVPLHIFLPGGWSTYDGEISDHLPVVIRLQP